jgi:hypothetical protein
MTVTDGNTTIAPGNGTDTNMTVTPTDGNTTVTPGNGTDTFICKICGEGMKIGDLVGVVTVTAQDDRTCQEYQLEGDGGQIDESECAEIQAVNTPCECEITL